MPEEALLSTVEVDQPAEDIASSEGTDAGSELGESGSASETIEAPELKGSSLWRETKAALYSGKALTKPQISAIRRAIQAEAQISEKYPEGLTAIESTLSAVKSLADEGVPVEQAIQETLQERNYFREFDDLYTRGDGKFAEKLHEASPEAFENIGPSFIRKYAEVAPEAYSAQVAQAVVQHMNSAEVPLQFRVLSTFLPQLPDGPAKDQVIQACEAIFGWSEGLKALSQKKIEPRQVPQSQQTQQQPQNGIDPQLDLSRREWNLETRDDGINMVLMAAQKEIAALKKTGLSEPEKKKVIGKVSEELDARLLMDKQYGTSMQGFLKSGNKSSYTQLLNSKRKAIVPAAVKRAVADVLAERPAKTAAQPGNGKQPAKTDALKPAQGAMQFRKITGPPKTLGLVTDLNRTPHSMLAKRQAYIKGEERPVSWG
jgi:hypothetical protein